jgi:choice-of-anchor C domain-containing protein
MYTLRSSSAIIVAFVLLALLVESAAGGKPQTDARGDDNLVVNGSFEFRRVSQPNGNIEVLATGSDVLTGWHIVTADDSRAVQTHTVDWIGPERWTASHGKCCLDLDGGVRQTVRTKAGQRYILSFDFAGNPEAGGMVQRLTVMIDGQSHHFEFDSTGKTNTDLGWTSKQVAFTAQRDRTTLTFLNARPNAQSAGVALDNVVIRTQDAADTEPYRELYLRMRRFEREADSLWRQDRYLEAQQHAEAAARYRQQFEELLGLKTPRQ